MLTVSEPKAANILTVDVEEWFHINTLDMPYHTWDQFDERVCRNTMQILELLERYGVKGTFFVLGWVADRHPSLIRSIAAAGHELGSHGNFHRMLDKFTEAEFREDLRASKYKIEDVSGQSVRMFRAPSWSVSKRNLNFLVVLEEEGFICDSSIQPFATPISGYHGAPCEPFYPVIGGKRLSLVEWPSTVFRFLGLRLPFSGGFYFRVTPSLLVDGALRMINRNKSAMVYVHPWEMDVEHRIPSTSWIVDWAHSVNVAATRGKLERLLQNHSFVSMGEAIRRGTYPERVLSP